MTRKSLTVSQIQKLDKRVIEKIGIPSVVLMENAGRSVAQSVFTDLKGKRNARVAVVCGTGNNGGDGFVAARHLSGKGVKVDVFVLGVLKQLKPDAQIFHRVVKNLNISCRFLTKLDQNFIKALRGADIVVDAVFGVGLNRPIEGLARDVINALNANAKRVIAVDIPSGLDGTTGKVWGIAVKAFKTITFSFPKAGFFKNDGPTYAGRMKVADIGIPQF